MPTSHLRTGRRLLLRDLALLGAGYLADLEPRGFEDFGGAGQSLAGHARYLGPLDVARAADDQVDRGVLPYPVAGFGRLLEHLVDPVIVAEADAAEPAGRPS